MNVQGYCWSSSFGLPGDHGDVWAFHQRSWACCKCWCCPLWAARRCCCCSGRLSTIGWTSPFLLYRSCCSASSDRVLLDLHPEHLSTIAGVKLRERATASAYLVQGPGLSSSATAQPAAFAAAPAVSIFKWVDLFEPCCLCLLEFGSEGDWTRRCPPQPGTESALGLTEGSVDCSEHLDLQDSSGWVQRVNSAWSGRQCRGSPSAAQSFPRLHRIASSHLLRQSKKWWALFCDGECCRGLAARERLFEGRRRIWGSCSSASHCSRFQIFEGRVWTLRQRHQQCFCWRGCHLTQDCLNHSARCL